MMNYKTQGVCSRAIHFDVVDNKVTNVAFEGGCSGNTQGVAALVEGMDIDEAIKRMKGIKSGKGILRNPPAVWKVSTADLSLLPARTSLQRL